jgi:phosphatidylserine decarboxylase
MSEPSGWRARLFVWLQYLLPQHTMSRVVLAATRVRTPWFKNLLIGAFLRMFTVDMTEAAQSGGSFATIYLAPFNYHRIHMPASGSLLDTVYVPGRLFSVSDATAQRVPRLFARNERVLTLFEGAFGQFAVVLVGALNVGSMATVWAGDITPARRRRLAHVPAAGIALDKGAELGRFNMGSTVILLFEPARARWRPELRSGSIVRFGESLGDLA